MEAFLTGPLYLGLAVSVVAMLVLFLRMKKGAVGLGSRHPALFERARELGAPAALPARSPEVSGDRLAIPRPDGGELTLSASHYGKQGPQWLWLGSPLARGPKPFGAPSAPRLPHAIIRRETDNDRTGKRLGLNLEPQTGDASFDAEAYIETRDREATLAILHAPGVGAVMREVLYHSDASIVLNAEGHAVALRWPRVGPAIDANHLAAAASALERLVAAMPAIEDPRVTPAQGRAKAAAVAGAVVASLLGVAAFGVCLYILTTRAPVGPAAVRAALGVAAGFVVVALAASWALSRKRPRGLARFAVMSILTLMLGPGIGVSAFAAINSFADSTSETAQVKVVSKRLARQRKSTRYFLTVERFPGASEPVEIAVGSKPFTAAVPEREVTVEIGRGALGFAWVRGVRAGP